MKKEPLSRDEIVADIIDKIKALKTTSRWNSSGDFLHSMEDMKDDLLNEAYDNVIQILKSSY